MDLKPTDMRPFGPAAGIVFVRRRGADFPHLFTDHSSYSLALWTLRLDERGGRLSALCEFPFRPMRAATAPCPLVFGETCGQAGAARTGRKGIFTARRILSEMSRTVN